MVRPRRLWVQLYRQEIGDVGVEDVPIAETQPIEEVATKVLLGYFNQKTIAPEHRPHHARVVSEDESVVLTLMATGSDSVEKL